MGYWSKLMSAVVGRTSRPDPLSRSVPNPFYMNFVSGVKRAQPKVTINYTKLRAFSESPIPRRAIDYIKNQVSMLDWDIGVTTGKTPNAQQKANINRAKRILMQPNSHESWRTFIEQTVEDMLVIGNANIEKKQWPENVDKPLVLFPFDAASLNLYTSWKGSPTQPRYAQVKTTGEVVDFLDSELMYIRYNPRTNTPWGLSPLEVASQTIEYLLNAQAYAGRRASNATPDFMIDLGEDVEQLQVKEVRQWWQDEVEGRGHMPIIGGGKGSKSIQLGANSDEGLFIKWQSFLITTIANAFGMDQQKFGAVLASRATGDILDDTTDEGAIRPLAHSIAAAINRDIIQALGYTDLEFRFRWTANFEDRKSLASIHQIYATNDVMMIDEMRAELGLDPLPQGKGQYTLAEYRAMYGGQVTISGQGMPGGLIHDESKTPTINKILDLATGQEAQKAKIQTDNQMLQQKNQNATPAAQTRSDKPTNQTRNNTKPGS